jgi:molybdopterin-guanine dinucleotide biosynthesis protein A
VTSAAILVGGRATRYGGQDKSALLVGGRSILDRQLEVLAAVADDILIVGREGTPATAGLKSYAPASTAGLKSRTTSRFKPARIRQVSDRAPDRGPLGGLDAALAAADHDTVIVVACDMPFVTGALLRRLLALTDEADAVVPRTEDGYHPLCAAYTRACQPVVARRLAQGRLALTGLFEELRTRVVTIEEIAAFGDPARLLANVNTPAAFDAIEVPLSHET